MTKTGLFRVAGLVFLYACATLQFVRFYVRNSVFYLNMPAYLAGKERLPFQERVLPILFLRPMFNSPKFLGLFTHPNSVATAQTAPFYALSIFSLLASAFLTQMLYRKVSCRHTLAPFVFPLFLLCVIWTYCLRNEANFAYPYDLLSLAFFTAGLYCIYERHFTFLAFIIFIGTFNRETTLFLVGIHVLDMASAPSTYATGTHSSPGTRRRLDPTLIMWWRTAALFSIWLAVKLSLAYYFRMNDRSEDFVRFAYNAERFRWRLIPALLNLCGYLLPVALMYWSRIRPFRFGNYAIILLLWLPIMFYSGVLLETRIYGELCSWTAVALILLAEDQTGRSRQFSDTNDISATVPEEYVAG